jgi:hypothetical protein
MGTSPAVHFTLWEPRGAIPRGHPTVANGTRAGCGLRLLRLSQRDATKISLRLGAFPQPARSIRAEGRSACWRTSGNGEANWSQFVGPCPASTKATSPTAATSPRVRGRSLLSW